MESLQGRGINVGQQANVQRTGQAGATNNPRNLQQVGGTTPQAGRINAQLRQHQVGNFTLTVPEKSKPRTLEQVAPRQPTTTTSQPPTDSGVGEKRSFVMQRNRGGEQTTPRGGQDTSNESTTVTTTNTGSEGTGRAGRRNAVVLDKQALADFQATLPPDTATRTTNTRTDTATTARTDTASPARTTDRPDASPRGQRVATDVDVRLRELIYQPATSAATWGNLKNAVPFGKTTLFGQTQAAVKQFNADQGQLSAAQKYDRLGTITALIGAWEAKNAGSTDAKATTIATTKAQVTQALADLRYPALQEKMPSGFQIDGQGRVGGRSVISAVPKDVATMRPDLADVRGGDVGAAIMEQAADKLRRNAEAGDDQKKGFLELAGTKVFRQATSDFFRFNYDIPTGPSQAFRSREDRATDQDVRNTNVANALLSFTGSAAATTVLSGVLVQDTLAAVSGMTADGDGKHLLLERARGTREQDGTSYGFVRNNQGVSERLELSDMGPAKWKLSRTAGGDFKISIDWPRHFEGVRQNGATERFPLDKDHALEARLSFDIIVDARAAANGQLAMTIPGGIEITYRGRLDQ